MKSMPSPQAHALSTDESGPPSESNNFDFLRFLFAVLVIFSHGFALAGTGRQEPLSLLTSGQTYLGEIAVDGFFAISGFLITASWLRSRTFWSYFSKRLLRIYPGFLAAGVLCLVFFGPLGAGSAGLYFHRLSVAQFLHHALLLDKLSLPPTFSHNPLPNQVNGSLWTIKIEMECYLLVAALGLVGGFRRRIMPFLLLLGASIVSGAAALHLPGLPHLPESVGEHLRFFVFFFAGMVFFLYRDRIVYRLPLLLGAACLLAAASGLHTLQAVLPLPLTYLLMYAAFASAGKLSRFGKKRDLSYGLYLYAWPVQQVLTLLLLARLPSGIAPYALFPAALLGSLLCAWVSWHVIEKPCLSLLRKPSHTQEARQIEAARGENLPLPACVGLCSPSISLLE